MKRKQSLFIKGFSGWLVNEAKKFLNSKRTTNFMIQKNFSSQADQYFAGEKLYTINKSSQEKGFLPASDIVGDGVYHAIGNHQDIKEDIILATHYITEDVLPEGGFLTSTNQEHIEELVQENECEVLPGVKGQQTCILMSSYNRFSDWQHEKKVNNLLYGTTAPRFGIEEPIGGDYSSDYAISKENQK